MRHAVAMAAPALAMAYKLGTFFFFFPLLVPSPSLSTVPTTATTELSETVTAAAAACSEMGLCVGVLARSIDRSKNERKRLLSLVGIPDAKSALTVILSLARRERPQIAAAGEEERKEGEKRQSKMRHRDCNLKICTQRIDGGRST